MRVGVLFNHAPIELSRSPTHGHEYIIHCWNNCSGGVHIHARRSRAGVTKLPGLLREVCYNDAAGTPWIFHIPLP